MVGGYALALDSPGTRDHMCCGFSGLGRSLTGRPVGEFQGHRTVLEGADSMWGLHLELVFRVRGQWEPAEGHAGNRQTGRGSFRAGRRDFRDGHSTAVDGCDLDLHRMGQSGGGAALPDPEDERLPQSGTLVGFPNIFKFGRLTQHNRTGFSSPLPWSVWTIRCVEIPILSRNALPKGRAGLSDELAHCFTQSSGAIKLPWLQTLAD